MGPRAQSFGKPVRRIAIVGTGVIGASWAAEYLARGFDVVATDPGPNAEAYLLGLLELRGMGAKKNPSQTLKSVQSR